MGNYELQRAGESSRWPRLNLSGGKNIYKTAAHSAATLSSVCAEQLIIVSVPAQDLTFI